MSLPSTQKLKARLKAVARREREVAAFAGLAKVAIALAIFSAVFFLVDWLFLLSVGARTVLLAAGVAAAAWIAKTDLYDPLRRRRDEVTTALEIESRFPELRDRLISVVQLSGGGKEISPALLERLEQETARMTEPMNFSSVIDWLFVRKMLLLALFLFATGFAAAVVYPQYVKTTFRRMFFGDVRYPSLTRIAVKHMSRRIAQGDDWNVQVALAGRIPATVTLKMRSGSRTAPAPRARDAGGGPASGGAVKKEKRGELPAAERRWTAIPMKPILGYTYGLALEKVQESFECQIFAGDAWTEVFEVKVLVPVAVLDPLLDVTPPAYAGLKPLRNAPLVGSTVLEGSTVTVKVPATKTVVEGRLIVAGAVPLPLQPAADETGATGTFTILHPSETSAVGRAAFPARNGAVSFTVRVKDADGLENLEPHVLYALRVQRDLAPKVRILAPRDERLSVPYAEWKMVYEAVDDFGVDKAWLVWEVFPSDGGEQSASAGDEPAAATAPKPLRTGRSTIHVETGAIRYAGEALLDMGSAKVVSGETLVARIEVGDARAAAAEGAAAIPDAIGRSPSVRFRIVDESEKWAEIQRRLQAVEEGVIHIRDRQEDVKKEVDVLKRKP